MESRWRSVISWNLNMFTLITLGVGAAYLYSAFAMLLPDLIPDSFKENGHVDVYFEAAAVIVALVLGGSQDLLAQGSSDMCIECHRALDSEPLAGPVEHFEADIHAAAGFGCVDCHGGDASIAGPGGMDPALGFLGAPRGEEVIVVCGRCHSDGEFMRQFNPSLRVDQVAEYWTSRHGQRLAATGDTAVATCSDCHGTHGILAAEDEVVGGRGAHGEGGQQAEGG